MNKKDGFDCKKFITTYGSIKKQQQVEVLEGGGEYWIYFLQEVYPSPAKYKRELVREGEGNVFVKDDLAVGRVVEL